MGVEIAVSDPGKITTRGVGGWCRVGGMRDYARTAEVASRTRSYEGFKITCIVLDQVFRRRGHSCAATIYASTGSYRCWCFSLMSKNTPPVSNGYFVRYDDGYESFSPVCGVRGRVHQCRCRAGGSGQCRARKPIRLSG